MHYCLFVKVLFFSLPCGLFHRSALWQFLAFPAKCFAIISQAFLFVKYFFSHFFDFFFSSRFPVRRGVLSAHSRSFCLPLSGCTPFQVDFLQSVCYQCCVCSPQRMLSYHRWLSPSSTFFIFLFFSIFLCFFSLSPITASEIAPAA